jgi:hypothetical protein
VLTADNLFDGTISTGTEQFYIEPSHKYSSELPKSGVHTIIYKLSDVKMDVHNHHKGGDDHEMHCASEKLRRKQHQQQADSRHFLYDNHKINNNDDDKVNEKSEINLNKFKLLKNDDDDDDVISSSSSTNNQGNAETSHKRIKRWLQVREHARGLMIIIRLDSIS